MTLMKGNLDYQNSHFASLTGGYNLTTGPPSSEAGPQSNGLEEEQAVPVMNLKPGSDNALPSPNGIAASNLLLLSSYLQEPSYRKLAKGVIDAFAIEIIQHPFLFVSILSANVLETVGVKSIVAVGDAVEHQLSGFGRTVTKLQESQGREWLVGRNPLLKNLKLKDGHGGRVMICAAGICRELKDGELDAQGEGG
jgi:uncharacterized protein YyaL (SSP411 family)